MFRIACVFFALGIALTSVTLVTALVFYVPTIHFSLMYERLGVHSSAWMGVLITFGTVGSSAAGAFWDRRIAYSTPIRSRSRAARA